MKERTTPAKVSKVEARRLLESLQRELEYVERRLSVSGMHDEESELHEATLAVAGVRRSLT